MTSSTFGVMIFSIKVSITVTRQLRFWDSSEATIRYGQFMVELLELSATRQDFATALIARNVAEFERLFGPITPSNQEHLFEMPPSFEIREQTFRILSPASQEVQ